MRCWLAIFVLLPIPFQLLGQPMGGNMVWQATGGAQVATAPAVLPGARSQAWHTYIYGYTDSLDGAHIRIRAEATAATVWVDGRLALQLQPGQEGTLSKRLFEAPAWHRVQVQLDRSTGFAWVHRPTVDGAQVGLPKILARPAPELPRLHLILILVVPVILLVGWRVSDVGTFDRLFALRPAYRKLYEDAQQGNLLRGISQVWALLLRIWLAGGVVAWAFSPARLQIPSWIQKAVNEQQAYRAPLLWVGICALGVAALLATRYLLLWWIGRGNGWRIFVRWVNSLDTLASLPLLLGVYLLVWGLQFPTGLTNPTTLSLLAWGAIGAFVLCHAYLLVRGLHARGLFSWVGLGLYICALEVLPWLLLVPARVLA